MKFKQFFQRRSSSSTPTKASLTPKKSEDGFLQLNFMKKEKKQGSPQVQNCGLGEQGLEGKYQTKQEVADDVQCENCGNEAQGAEAMLQLGTNEDIPNGSLVEAINEEIGILGEVSNEKEALNESHGGSSSGHMQSFQEHEIALMKAKDETERIKAMYEEMCTNVKDISSQLENLKQEFDGKKKEWEKSQIDFMLCIRSAERFAREAEARAKTVEAENIRLKEELNKVQNLSSPLQCLEMNYSNGQNGPRRANGAVDQEQTEKVSNGDTIVIPSPQASVKDCEDGPKQKPIPFTDSKPSYQYNGTKNRNGKLENLRKTAGGSLRNALLRWCREQTKGYENIEINNFSTSWQDGKAFAALLHSLEPTAFDYSGLITSNPLAKYEVAINSAKQLGVKVELDIVDVLSTEDPPWEKILQFVTEVYCAVTP